ncbi:MAG: hypothetical protein CEE38_07875 [Planctomycetes bacterium B3_Pla]|nr:MAG: hypothetical protein CEE38_07875 [Planctomycetes bacterium B3_Pla]
MKEVFDALYTHYEADVALVLAIGSLSFMVGPQADRASQRTYPYTVYSSVSQVHEHITFTEKEESFLFQFTVYTKFPDDIEIALLAFIGTDDPAVGFDDALLSPAGFEPSKLHRESVVRGHRESNDVYSITVTYSIDLEIL